MAARDYAWLAASAISWSRRDDLVSLVPDLVLFAEERLSADLEARGIESVMTLPTVAGVASVSLPAEVVEIRSIGIPNQLPLARLSVDAFNTRYSTGDAGVPRNYSVIGDALYLGPKPDAVYQLALNVRRTIPPLSADSPSNWLITRNPSLYLAAVMVELMINVRDAEGQAIWEGKYAVALNAANSTKDTGGQLVARPDTNTP